MRARALPFLLIAGALAACSPKPPPAQAVTLDCVQGFDVLKTKIMGQPGVVPAPVEASEPYRAYSMADGKTSYYVTEPGAPAYPAILMQQVATGGKMTNTGCAYGDHAAYQELMAYLTGLRAAVK